MAPPRKNAQPDVTELIDSMIRPLVREEIEKIVKEEIPAVLQEMFNRR